MNDELEKEVIEVLNDTLVRLNSVGDKNLPKVLLPATVIIEVILNKIEEHATIQEQTK